MVCRQVGDYVTRPFARRGYFVGLMVEALKNKRKHRLNE